MDSALFPSGDWYGFYTYFCLPGRHSMDIRFTFENGKISANGADPVGEFVLDGVYDETSRECSWVKTYVGRHSVSYQGVRDGKGIWGTWQIRRFNGGFHIWPLKFGGLTDSATEKEREPESNVAAESR